MVICLERGADCLQMVQLMPLHPQTPSSLSSFKSRLVLPFWYRHTQVVLEKRPLNGYSSSSSSWCGKASVQHCVRLSTYTVSVTLLTFVAQRRAAAAIDRYLLPARPTAANPPHAGAGCEWDRQTDHTVLFHSSSSAHYAGSANNRPR